MDLLVEHLDRQVPYYVTKAINIEVVIVALPV